MECHHMLMNQFERSPSFERPKFLHQCCDVCMKKCKCLNCEALLTATTHSSTVVEKLCSSPTISPEKQKQIRGALLELRRKWCKNSDSPTAYLLVGEEVCTGLTDGAINYIVENFYNITGEASSPWDCISLVLSRIVGTVLTEIMSTLLYIQKKHDFNNRLLLKKMHYN